MKMAEWRVFCRSKRLARKIARQAALRGHLSDLGTGWALCGKRVNIMPDLMGVTCQTCLKMHKNGPSINRVLKEKTRERLLKTVAW